MEPPIRAKSRRSRIKDKRSKRAKRRFYIATPLGERSRKSGVRLRSPKKNNHDGE